MKNKTKLIKAKDDTNELNEGVKVKIRPHSRKGPPCSRSDMDRYFKLEPFLQSNTSSHLNTKATSWTTYYPPTILNFNLSNLKVVRLNN